MENQIQTFSQETISLFFLVQLHYQKQKKVSSYNTEDFAADLRQQAGFPGRTWVQSCLIGALDAFRERVKVSESKGVWAAGVSADCSGGSFHWTFSFFLCRLWAFRGAAPPLTLLLFLEDKLEALSEKKALIEGFLAASSTTQTGTHTEKAALK